MSVATAVGLDVSESNKKGLSRLISVSHNRPMDFADALDWESGVDRTRLPKVPEHSWLYGTALYDQLTEEQRLECLWMEIARDVSMFISLEQTIPVLYMGYVNQYQGQLSKDIYEYLMIFSKEEIVVVASYTSAFLGLSIVPSVILTTFLNWYGFENQLLLVAVISLCVNIFYVTRNFERIKSERIRS